MALRKDDSASVGAVNIGEYVRINFLLWLVAVYIILVILIGGLKGIKSVGALGFSIIFIIALLLPMSIQGYNPIWVAIFVSAINSILTFLLIGGISKKSIAGILGTIGGLFITAILSFISSIILRFVGQDVSFGFLDLGKRLWMSPESTNWNFTGIMIAGMIIGASGAIMDASMAVASAIEQVKKANPNSNIWDCVRAGMNVGRDEIGTMANTLIFAYIGADLTLILLPMFPFGEAGRAMPFTRIINEEATSSEIVQAITGTIGIVMAIPITALIAGFLIGKGSQKTGDHVDNKLTESKNRYSKFVFPVIMLFMLLGIHFTYFIARNSSESQVDKSDRDHIVSEYVRAKVIDKGEFIESPSPFSFAIENAKSEILNTKILGGNFKNKQALVQNIHDPNRMPLYNLRIKKGDDILLKVDGTKDYITRTLINNYSRDGYLIYLIGFLILIIVVVGRFQGIRTIIALALSITVILKLMMPLIVAGYNAIIVSVIVCGIIALLTLLIVTGFNRKSGSATVGIIGGVLVASLIVIYADQYLHFTGISSSRTAMLMQFTTSEKINFRNILMAGIIMGLLGSAVDAGIAVASSVREVRRANPKLSVRQLMSAGMVVGTDLIGTIANTLVFAYLGLRLILLMTFSGTSIISGNKMEIINTETLSAEILRMIAGSIGLVLTIPITAFVASVWDKIVGFLGFGKEV
ncbi:TPA: YibE/F family protein [bacterium]|nr:YibE/F family protein [bacterium]